jgi:hypothetical protein
MNIALDQFWTHEDNDGVNGSVSTVAHPLEGPRTEWNTHEEEARRDGYGGGIDWK